MIINKSKHISSKCRCASCKSTRGEYKGKNHPNYKSGLPHCNDCGKELSRSDATLCFNCYQKERFKGNKPNCWICGKQLTASGCTLCWNCYVSLKKSNNIHNHCVDCNKEISSLAKRCGSCSSKKRIFSLETRKKCSLAHKGKKCYRWGKPAPHGKHMEYNGILFRSSWEVAYAKYLDRQGTKWQYEPKAFDLGNTTYRPDFYLPNTNTYIEIKGWWRDDAKEKFNLFRKKYSNINIQVLYKSNLKTLKIL